MTATASAPSLGQELTGTGDVARLVLRRDRVLLVAWVALMALLPAGLVPAVVAGYPTEELRQAFAAATAANPAELALRGPVFASTVGGLVAWTVASSGALLNAVVNILVVIRHSRAEEVTGRRELISATAVGRPAPLAGALSVVAAGNLAVALLVTGGLVLQGLPASGALALGLGLAASGISFAGVAALVAQVVEAPGTARGIAISVLGVFFALAAVGDLTGSGLVWATPIGWMRHLEAFAGERWWILGLFAAFSVALGAVALALAGARDLGAGLLPPRPGPASAARSLTGPLALAWRRTRAQLVAWAIGLAALGLLMGTVTSGIGSQLDTPAFQQLAARVGGGSPAEVLLMLVLYVLAQVATVFGLTTVLTLRTDETAGLAEPILTTATSRVRWLGASLTIAASGVALVLIVLGAASGLGASAFGRLLGTSVAFLPACLVLIGLATALYGWAPRLAVPVTWAAFGVVLVVDLLGEFGLLGMPWLLISPYIAILSAVRGASALAPSVLLLCGVASVLYFAGLAGIRRRDLGA